MGFRGRGDGSAAGLADSVMAILSLSHGLDLASNRAGHQPILRRDLSIGSGAASTWCVTSPPRQL
jgi:hypothetical protein